MNWGGAGSDWGERGRTRGNGVGLWGTGSDWGGTGSDCGERGRTGGETGSDWVGTVVGLAGNEVGLVGRTGGVGLGYKRRGQLIWPHSLPQMCPDRPPLRETRVCRVHGAEKAL